jgi:uncharacterized protein (DUF427 family)
VRSRPPRIEPGPGQESVWDYPRPPIVVPTDARVRIVHAGVTIADTRRALRVLETSQAPAYYLPPADLVPEHLVRTKGRSFCEWKGAATYWAVHVGAAIVPDAAWSYQQPNRAYQDLAGYLSFYPQRVDECWVDDEQVQPNAGSFYGGWVTSRVVGPFKGEPGTEGW